MSNMLTPIIIEGRAAKDPELTTNQETGSKFVRLNIIQNKGFTRDSEHILCFSCFFYGNMGERLINAKVKKGSLLTIVGDFDSKEYMRSGRDNPNEQIHDRSLEVSVSSWSYTPQNKPKDETPNQTPQGNAQGQTQQGAPTPPAQNYPPMQSAASQQPNYQQQYQQQAAPANYQQQPPTGGYQQPAGAAYNSGTANGFANAPHEPLPFNN